MSELIALIALVVLGVPTAIVYLLVRASSTKYELAQLKQKMSALSYANEVQATKLEQLHEIVKGSRDSRLSPDGTLKNDAGQRELVSEAKRDISQNTQKPSPFEKSPSTDASIVKESSELKPFGPSLVGDSSENNSSENSNLESSTLENTSIENISPGNSSFENSDSAGSRPETQEKTTDKQSAGNETQSQEKPVIERKPVTPTLLDRGVALVKRYFTEGNVIVRVGVLVLFVGVAFLLKYASDNSMLPIEFRAIGVALAGIVILSIGWRLRLKRADYALVMQGAGIGILYLTAFASLKLFNLLPAGFVLACLLLMVVLSAALSIFQNSRALAVLAISGGFLAPVLSSSGGGSHIALFGFYTILNLGVFCIAWFKSWRLLNLVGFVFTFVIGSAWGLTSYQSTDFLSAELFLVVFFLMYVAISILFAHRQEPKLKGYVDGTLVFGLPLVVSSLQAGLVYSYEFALAYSSLALGAFYISLAWVFQRGFGSYKPDPKLHLLSESFLVLGFVFASLTIPFALEGEWIASAWALEGAALLWINIKQKRILGVGLSLALQLLGGLGFLDATNGTFTEFPIVNSIFMGAFIVAAAGTFSSIYLKRNSDALTKYFSQRSVLILSKGLLVWGLSWWIINGVLEINAFVARPYQGVSLLLFFAFTSLLALALEKKFQWDDLQWNGYATSLSMLGLFLWFGDSASHPFAGFAWLGWFTIFAALFYFLWQKRDVTDTSLNTRKYLGLHLFALWLGCIILSWEVTWQVRYVLGLSNAWLVCALALPSLFVLNSLPKIKVWPFSMYRSLYCGIGLLPLVVYLLAWCFVSNINNGNSFPLIYIPLLNPLEIIQALVILSSLFWWRSSGKFIEITTTKNVTKPITDVLTNTIVFVIYCGLIFFCLNSMLLRVLHHWLDVSYSVNGIMFSSVAQASLSVFWTVLGLATMIVSSRFHWRQVWLCAAVLLGVTVAKLFFIDLGDRDTLVTIFSFIVVGGLLLVVGYFSPIPPKKHKETVTHSDAHKSDSQESDGNEGQASLEER